VPRIAAFRNWASLILAALALLVPAAVGNAHALTHASAPILVDSHHQGDGDPAASTPEDQESPAAPDDRDGGHDHLQSLSVAVGAIFGSAPLQHPPLPEAAPIKTDVDALPLYPTEPPPSRPPAFA